MKTENTANIGFEKEIWDAACILRGNLDASEYKQVVSGLIFLKNISDKFEARYNEPVAEGEVFLDKYNGEGTVFGCINKDSLKSLRVNISPESILSGFEERASPIDRKYFVGVEGNMRRTKLCETLLPKLMSSEIDVSEVEI